MRGSPQFGRAAGLILRAGRCARTGREPDHDKKGGPWRARRKRVRTSGSVAEESHYVEFDRAGSPQVRRREAHERDAHVRDARGNRYRLFELRETAQGVAMSTK